MTEDFNWRLMLKQLGLQRLSRLINQALATDPLILELFGKLHQKTLCVHVLKIPLNVWVAFHPYGVELKPAAQDAIATVSLSGSPSALLRFAKTTAHTQMLMNKEVKIQGDLDLLMEVKKIQQRLQIDWEGLFAGYVGDFAANRILLVAKRARDKVSHHLKLVQSDGLDYLQHEARLLPTEVEVNHFYREILQLRRDIERFEARLKKY